MYNIIYADPPWTYTDKATAGERGAGFKYSLMSLEDIKKLPVQKITAENCALFLWSTFPQLPNCLKVVEAWGFQYKTAAFVWAKTNPKSGTFFWGMGNHTRSNAEVCLLGIKGRMKRQSASVHSLLVAPRGRHSEKPKETRTRIVQLFGDMPRIELFARDQEPGWDVWGYEVNSSIKLGEDKNV